jgi:hypothetical protein
MSVCLSVCPREGVYRADPTGTCLPSLSHGNQFTEPMPREPVYRAYPMGICLPSRSHGNVYKQPMLVITDLPNVDCSFQDHLHY